VGFQVRISESVRGENEVQKKKTQSVHVEVSREVKVIVGQQVEARK
jgi:hypothetical protein